MRAEIAKIYTEFLHKKFGIITVIDAFVKYNTLRGSDYVTAKEFIEAVSKLNEVDSQLVVETLESGVIIIRLGWLNSSFLQKGNFRTNHSSELQQQRFFDSRVSGNQVGDIGQSGQGHFGCGVIRYTARKASCAWTTRLKDAFITKTICSKCDEVV